VTPTGPRIAVRVALVVAFLAAALWLAWPDILRTTWIGAYGLAAGYLIIRRPGNSIGWLLMLIAASFTGLTDLTDAQIAATQREQVEGTEAFRIWVGAMSGAWAFLAYGLLGLVFPSGSLPRGRGRRPLLVLITVAMMVTGLAMIHPSVSVTVSGSAATLMVPNPYALLPDLAFWSSVPNADLAFVPVVLVLVVGVASVAVRAVRSTGILRLQMRWLAAALATLLAGVALGAGLIAIGGPSVGDVAWLPVSAAFLTIPAAILVAVLRHRLLEIDRIISRTVGWAGVSLVLAATFVSVTLALQAVLEPLTQGGSIAVAASTLLTLALLQPLRARIQRVVDRRFDRTATDHDRLLAEFGRRLRDELDLETVRRMVEGTSRQAVQPDAAGVWLRPVGAPR
jgi:hypothetical protein